MPKLWLCRTDGRQPVSLSYHIHEYIEWATTHFYANPLNFRCPYFLNQSCQVSPTWQLFGLCPCLFARDLHNIRQDKVAGECVQLVADTAQRRFADLQKSEPPEFVDAVGQYIGI